VRGRRGGRDFIQGGFSRITFTWQLFCMELKSRHRKFHTLIPRSDLLIPGAKAPPKRGKFQMTEIYKISHTSHTPCKFYPRAPLCTCMLFTSYNHFLLLIGVRHTPKLQEKVQSKVAGKGCRKAEKGVLCALCGKVPGFCNPLMQHG